MGQILGDAAKSQGILGVEGAGRVPPEALTEAQPLIMDF
jgi:hypothetical protein